MDFAVRLFRQVGNFSALEGDWLRTEVSVIEFPSRQAAEAWYRSPEYQAIVPLRRDGAVGIVAIIDGN
jgi:uncharacterized protein (DUF1330 family)